MKKIFVLLILSSFLYACQSEKKETILKPELLHEVKGLAHAESVVYDSKRNVLYVSVQGDKVIGDGTIAKVSLDGKIIDLNFISGLNDPKGIAITGNKLYVSDVKELVEADLETGNIIHKYTTATTQFLNDVEIGKDGTVYVSDTFKSSIFKLATDGTFSEWHNNNDLEHPNGLLIKENNMYVGAWGNIVGEGDKGKQSGHLLKMDMKTKEIAKVSKDTLGNLDGVQIYDKNNLIISAWMSGKIMKINDNGDVEDLLTVERSVGDILYIPEKKLLALPMNLQSKLLIYEFQEEEIK